MGDRFILFMVFKWVWLGMFIEIVKCCVMIMVSGMLKKLLMGMLKVKLVLSGGLNLLVVLLGFVVVWRFVVSFVVLVIDRFVLVIDLLMICRLKILLGLFMLIVIDLLTLSLFLL